MGICGDYIGLYRAKMPRWSAAHQLAQAPRMVKFQGNSGANYMGVSQKIGIPFGGVPIIRTIIY